MLRVGNGRRCLRVGAGRLEPVCGVHGIVALTCGAGKTFVGMAAMARVGESTLVLCSSTTGARYGITFTRATLLRPNPPPKAITKVGV